METNEKEKKPKKQPGQRKRLGDMGVVAWENDDGSVTFVVTDRGQDESGEWKDFQKMVLSEAQFIHLFSCVCVNYAWLSKRNHMQAATIAA